MVPVERIYRGIFIMEMLRGCGTVAVGIYVCPPVELFSTDTKNPLATRHGPGRRVTIYPTSSPEEVLQQFAMRWHRRASYRWGIQPPHIPTFIDCDGEHVYVDEYKDHLQQLTSCRMRMAMMDDVYKHAMMERVDVLAQWDNPPTGGVQTGPTSWPHADVWAFVYNHLVVASAHKGRWIPSVKAEDVYLACADWINNTKGQFLCSKDDVISRVDVILGCMGAHKSVRSHAGRNYHVFPYVTLDTRSTSCC